MHNVLILIDGVDLLWHGLWICAMLLQAGGAVRVLWCSMHVVCEVWWWVRRVRLRCSGEVVGRCDIGAPLQRFLLRHFAFDGGAIVLREADSRCRIARLSCTVCLHRLSAARVFGEAWAVRSVDVRLRGCPHWSLLLTHAWAGQTVYHGHIAII